MRDWVPLLQSLLWILLIVGVMTVYRRGIALVVDAIAKRIAAGSSLKVGPVEIGELKVELSQVRRDLNEANEKIGKLFLATMAPAMYQNLKKLSEGNFGSFEMSRGLERELYYLRDIGYVNADSIQAIPKSGANLSAFVTVTTNGQDFVNLREAVAFSVAPPN